jgi:hypothetical protein
MLAAYPLGTIRGNVRLWKLLVQARCRAMERVAEANERMAAARAVPHLYTEDRVNEFVGGRSWRLEDA